MSTQDKKRHEKTMKKQSIFAALLAVATTNPDGFTVSKQLQPITTGFAVALEATQNSFGRSGLRRVINYASANRVDAFGGWYDSQSGLYYWDAVIICSTIEEAEKLARDNKQLAFYDLANNIEHRCA